MKPVFKHEYTATLRFSLGSKVALADLRAAILRAVRTKAFWLVGRCEVVDVQALDGQAAPAQEPLDGPQSGGRS